MSAVLYFAYTALLSPDRMSETAPSAEFRFIAHLPETELVFPILDDRWKGGLPSVRPMAGNTVWGAVFEIPADRIGDLDPAERSEGRIPSDGFRAVDRQGRGYRVRTHAAESSDEATVSHFPSRGYMDLVVRGARRWGLPTGWVAGLEERITGPPF